MGWFDEQIRARKNADQAVFEDSFQSIAGAVMGRRMSENLNDRRQVTTDAIEEILRYYRVRPCEIPDNLRDLNEVLEYLLRPYGIMRRTVRLEKGWYRDAAGPMLGTRKDDGSAVALIPSGFTGYRFYDRKTGKNVRVTRKNEGLLETEAIAFYKPFPMKKLNAGSMMRYIIEQISVSDLVMLIAAMAAATGVGLIYPRLNAVLLSDVLVSGSGRLLLGMAVYMIAVSLSSLVFGIVKDLISAKILTKLNISVGAASMMRVLSMPVAFFRQYSAGEMASRVGSVNTLVSMIVSMALSTGLTSVFSLAYIVQIFHYTPALAVPALVITALTVVSSAVTVLLQAKISRQRMELEAKESGITHAMVNGIQKIKLSGAEQRAFARWGRLYAQSAKLNYNPPMLLRISSVISKAITLIGALVLYYAAVRSGVSSAEYFAFNAAYGAASGAFIALTGIASSIAQIKPVLEMVRPILETEPEIEEGRTVITKLNGGVELNNVSFRYQEDMPLILDNLSLRINPGQYVAIVGKTGCGKSTLVRLLLGFETPQKGAVYYDGRDLKTLDLKSVRRLIGSVMQDGKLFMGDIYSNIVISAPWLTVDDAWEAAELAGLAADIRQMPMGMHTMISEGQGGISGGQRQRMMIARAVAPKPRILIFDEATSALDNLTQKQVSDALGTMKCTRIVIAHRLSTIRQCDRIIVLDHGTIIEDGTYDELIARDGFFAELVARQRLDETETPESAITGEEKKGFAG